MSSICPSLHPSIYQSLHPSIPLFLSIALPVPLATQAVHITKDFGPRGAATPACLDSPFPIMGTAYEQLGTVTALLPSPLTVPYSPQVVRVRH